MRIRWASRAFGRYSDRTDDSSVPASCIAWLAIWRAAERLSSLVKLSEQIEKRTDQRPLHSSDEDGAGSIQPHRPGTIDEQIRRGQIDQENRHPDHAPFHAGAGRPRNVDQQNKRRVEDEQPRGNRPASENGEPAHTANGI